LDRLGKMVHHRGTEVTEKRKNRLLLCALCASVVK
jgi:hypothetical protein